MAVVASSPSGASYADLFRGPQRARSLAMMLMLFVATLDVLIVITAMPAIAVQLGDVHLYSWVFSAYTLASLASLPIFGGLADRFPTLRVMLGAVGVFMLGSVWAALAPSMLMLVIGRALQGIGAGGLFALPNLIIARHYPAALQPRALAMTSAVWGVSALLGPVVGGALLGVWGWHAIFWVNIPIGLVLIVLGIASLRGSGGGSQEAAPTNLLNPVLLAAATGLLLAATTAGGIRAVALVAAGVLVALLYRISERRSLPIVPPEAWRGAGALGASIAIMGLIAIGFTASETFLTLLLQSGRGLSATSAGALISAGSLSWMGGTFLVSRRNDIGPRAKTLFGIGALLLGLVGLLVFIVLALPVAVAFGCWMLAGLGMGTIYPSCTTVVLDNAQGHEAGRITAAGQLMQTLGSSVGAAVAGAVATFGFGPGFSADQLHGAALNATSQADLARGVLYAVAVGLAAVVLASPLARNLPAERQV